MKIMVSRDGYTVTGNKPLKHFGVGVASLNQDLTNWIILLDKKDSIIEPLKQNEISLPRISLFNDRLYVIIEGTIEEYFHYIMDIDDYQDLLIQINNEKKVSFGVLNQEKNAIEEVLLFDIYHGF